MTSYLTNFVRWCLYAVLFTPFFIYRQTIFPFITLHTFYFEAVVLFAFFGWAILAALEPRFRPRLTPLFWAISGLLAALFLSSFLGSDPSRSLWSNPERLIGSVAYLFFFGYFLVLAGFLRSGEIKLRKYLSTAFAVSVAVALVAIWQYFNPTLFFGLDLSQRVGSLWGNPTYLAIYLIFNIFLALWLGKESGKGMKWLFWGFAVLETGVVFLTQTRGDILGLILGFLVLLGYFVWRPGEDGKTARRVRQASLALLALIVIAGGIFLVTRDNPFWLKLPGFNRLSRLSVESFLASDRNIVWQIAWQGFKDKPVLGYGPENFIIPFGIHFDPEILHFGKGQIFDRPHNIFLDYMATTGIVGLIAYLALLVSAFYALRGQGRPFLAAALLAYIVQAALAFDIMASLLPLFMIFAVIDYFYRPEAVAGKSLLNQSSVVPATVVSGVVAAAIAYFIIILPLYRNYLHFWAELSVNSKDFAAAQVYFDKELNGPFVLYRDQMLLDRAEAINIILRSGFGKYLPSIKENIAVAAEGVGDANARNPKDISYKIVGINLMNSAFAVTSDKQYAAKAEALEKAGLELSPKRQEMYYGVIETLMLEGKYDEALAAADKVIHLTENDYAVDAHYLKGVILFAQNKPKDAALEMHKALEMGYGFENGSQARVVADRLGDAGYYGDAIRLYQRALMLNPGDVESRMKIGLVYFMKEDLTMAKKVLEQVAADSPDLKNLPGFQNFAPVFNELGIKYR